MITCLRLLKQLIGKLIIKVIIINYSSVKMKYGVFPSQGQLVKNMRVWYANIYCDN